MRREYSPVVGVFLLLFFIADARPLLAWDDKTHSTITRLALQDDPALRQVVPTETFEDFLTGTEYKNIPNFIQALRLNPSTTFPLRLPQQTSSDPITILDVLATCVNEPDWGMDREICVSYPGFCKTKDKKDYKFMGALKSGISSQAFRHMYWPTGYIKVFSKYLPILKNVQAPLGEAPERSQLFFDLSVQAARTGHPYWAARLLAWSMHYAQDATQPYHAAQLPSKELESKKLHVIPDVNNTIRRIAYYHLAFEGYISLLLAGGTNMGEAGDAVRQTLLQAIPTSSNLPQDTARDITKAAAEHSTSESFAERTAIASIRYFPKVPGPNQDLETFLRSAAFKEEVLRQARPGPILDEFASIARSCLAEGGAATRTLVRLFYQQVRAKIQASHDPATPEDFQRSLSTFDSAFTGH